MLKNIGMFGIVGAGVAFGVAVLVLLANVGQEPMIERRVWVRDIQLPSVGDADPGAGQSGWLNMTVYYNETGDPASYYARNLTNNASSYAWTNTNNSHAGSDVPYGTALALWYKVRINVSDGYCAGNSTWMPTWVYCNVTSAGLSLSDVGMDRYLIGSNSTYMWLAFVYQGGISISMGQNVTGCRFDVDIYK